MGIQPFREYLSNYLGFAFGTKRNTYSALGYTRGPIQYDDAVARYKREGVLSRVIDAYPDAIWTRSPTIIDKPTKKPSSQFHEFASQTNLFHYLNRAERLAGLGKYSVILLGFNDISSQSDLSKPITKSNSISVNFVQAYGFGDCQIESITSNPSDPNFGLPEIYAITPNLSLDGNQSSVLYVHHSRILHIADGRLENEIFGCPLIEKIYNYLDDLVKVAGGGSEAAWQASYKGIQWELDKTINLTEDEAKALKDEIEAFEHGMTRHVRTRGMKINQLGADQIDAGPMFNVVMALIASTTGIPLRILIGSEQGKLASEQDRANWATRVIQRRKMHSEPKVLVPLLRKLIYSGVLKDVDYTFDWPDPFSMSPLERAQMAAQQARSAVNISRTIIQTPDLLSQEEARGVIFAKGDISPTAKEVTA